MFTLRAWHDRDMLLGTVQRALEAAACGTRRTGQRGNAAAAAFISALVPRLFPAIRGAVS
jgi:hypothetical protein